MELGKVRVTVNREALKNKQWTSRTEPLDGSMELPVDDLVPGILHRLMREE